MELDELKMMVALMGGTISYRDSYASIIDDEIDRQGSSRTAFNFSIAIGVDGDEYYGVCYLKAGQPAFIEFDDMHNRFCCSQFMAAYPCFAHVPVTYVRR